MTDDIQLSVTMAKRIELWPLARLKPYDRNARIHSAEQVAQIAASIVEFGFVNPILVDSNDGIIAGHGRLSAAQELGLRPPGSPCRPGWSALRMAGRQAGATKKNTARRLQSGRRQAVRLPKDSRFRGSEVADWRTGGV